MKIFWCLWTRQASILSHRPSSCPSWRNSYQQLLRYEFGQKHKLFEYISYTTYVGFTFYGVISVNQSYCGYCDICCLCLWMKSVTHFCMDLVWFEHNWPVGPGYWLSGSQLPISYLSAGNRWVMDWLSAGYGLSTCIGWLWAGYELAIGSTLFDTKTIVFKYWIVFYHYHKICLK